MTEEQDRGATFSLPAFSLQPSTFNLPSNHTYWLLATDYSQDPFWHPT